MNGELKAMSTTMILVMVAATALFSIIFDSKESSSWSFMVPLVITFTCALCVYRVKKQSLGLMASIMVVLNCGSFAFFGLAGGFGSTCGLLWLVPVILRDVGRG